MAFHRIAKKYLSSRYLRGSPKEDLTERSSYEDHGVNQTGCFVLKKYKNRGFPKRLNIKNPTVGNVDYI